MGITNITFNGDELPDDSDLEISSTSAVTLVEGGDTDTFTVNLSARPPANVSVSVTSSDTSAVTVSPSTLTFMPINYDAAQTVTITPASDNDGSDTSATITVKITSTVKTRTKTKAITVRDDDGGIDRGDISLEINEGESESFDVKLASPPVSSTTLSISSLAGVTVSPSTLTFTSSNYQTTQSVTVTANEDDDGTDGSSIVSFVAGGGYRASIAKTIAVLDDDGSIDVSGEAVELVEGSKNGSFTLTLGAPPTSNATISVTSKDPGAVKVSPATLTFTSSNHSTAQTVNLVSVSDDDADDESVTIELSATSGYRASDATKSISVIDAREGSIILDRPTEAVVVDEGGSATFTVRLSTKPTKNVSISLSFTHDDLTLSPTSLTFTASNWNTPQIVTVSAAHDDRDTDDENDTITLAATGGLIADDVVKRVSLVDDDIAGSIRTFDASGSSLSTASVFTVDEGSFRAFTVDLDARPNANVDISLSFTNDDITLTPTSLTFTESNWDVPQSITVAAERDSDTEDDSDTLTLSASGGIVAPNSTVRIAVKEAPSGTIHVPSTLAIDEWGFSMLNVSLQTTQSPSNVPVVVSLSNDNDHFFVSPSSLTFTASNWSTPQSVIVTHRPDDDETEDSDTITLSASGGIDAANETVAVVTKGSIRGAILTNPPRAIDIDEGETGRFSVTLDAIWNEEDSLNAQVVVSVESINRKVMISPTLLSFTASDWNVPQTVTLTSRHDDDSSNEPDIIVLNASRGIDARRGTLLVNVKDDDIPSGAIVMSDSELIIEEGGLRVFGVRLSEKPNENEDVIISLSKHSFGITLPSDSLIFDASDWNTIQPVAVGAMQDDDIEDETHTITLTVRGGIVAPPRTKRIRVIDDDETGPDPVKSRALAFPSIAAQDDATLRVRCNQDMPCNVHLDCSAQDDGSVFQGQLPAIPAWGTHTLGSADIERAIGGSWSGRGRLGCALRSRANISSQVWTRSGDGVLVNNSALIRSALENAENARQRADIESIPSPDEADQSNLRIRCIAPAGAHCTKTSFSCFDDRGRQYDGGVGTIVRLTTRHLQSDEVAAIIGHRWSKMGLSCELRSDHPFTVQVLTRTGGGGALVNNSATGMPNP